jgi:hypothetical protein
MMDVLRAMHFGGPTSLSIQEFSLRLSPTSYQLNSVLEMAVSGSGPLPADFSSNSALLLLIAILAEINTATTVFHPFEELVNMDGENQRHSKYSNPHLPFSVNTEASQAKRRLQRALDSWHQAYLDILEPELLSLYYFSRLQLVFPSLQYLPILAGYPPRVARNTTPTSVLYKRVKRDLKTVADALKYAWLILESCNTEIEVTPPWFPIAVFHASLVVWIMIILDGESRTRGSLKVLAVFKVELETMKWPCCRVMADLLVNLMKGEHSMPIVA